MLNETRQALEVIKNAEKLVFLTGAGISVPSGIPDYRSLEGVYSGIEQPEYLLSQTCLEKEPDKFYQFVMKLYHPEAQPNIIHKKIAELEKRHTETWVITQNIDQLHQKAGTSHVINFHGNLYEIYCQKCNQKLSYHEYQIGDTHTCGGRIRPDIVLYEEMLKEQTVKQSIQKITAADVVVVVGTSLKVYPFAGLLQYTNKNTPIILINKEAVTAQSGDLSIMGDATLFFEQIE